MDVDECYTLSVKFLEISELFSKLEIKNKGF